MKGGRIYILPTGFGFLFILSSVLMILVAATYQNNLVNLLAFFMLSLVFVAMVQTHNNLKDIRVSAIETEGGFAGETWAASIILHNPTQEDRHNIDFELKCEKKVGFYENTRPLLRLGSLHLRASYPAKERGRHHLPAIKISSVFPLGLFRSWIWFKHESSYLVYPSRAGNRTLPISSSSGERIGGSLRSEAGDDFYGHRKFQTGDSAHHVDWKAHARGRPLLVKEFKDSSSGFVRLDWNHLEGLDTEQRLSQLACWVDECKRRQLPFSLRLPGVETELDQGPEHAAHCLERLAIYPISSTQGEVHESDHQQTLG